MINKKHISLSILLWGIYLLIMSCIAIYFIIVFGIQSFDEIVYQFSSEKSIEGSIADFGMSLAMLGIVFISIPIFSIFKYWITADKKINIVMPYFMALMIISLATSIVALISQMVGSVDFLLLIHVIITFSFAHYVSNSKNYKKRFGKNYEYKS